MQISVEIKLAGVIPDVKLPFKTLLCNLGGSMPIIYHL